VDGLAAQHQKSGDAVGKLGQESQLLQDQCASTDPGSLNEYEVTRKGRENCCLPTHVSARTADNLCQDS
jgi:hypothetical protein